MVGCRGEREEEMKKVSEKFAYLFEGEELVSKATAMTKRSAVGKTVAHSKQQMTMAQQLPIVITAIQAEIEKAADQGKEYVYLGDLSEIGNVVSEELYCEMTDQLDAHFKQQGFFSDINAGGIMIKWGEEKKAFEASEASSEPNPNNPDHKFVFDIKFLLIASIIGVGLSLVIAASIISWG